jgi:hypothetical protein
MTEDIWAWSGERHGLYSMRSAYRMLVESAYHRDAHVEERTSNSEAHYNWRWKKLWRCKVPPKVQVFLWRVLNEFVPSRYNLHRRHVEPLSICTTCGAQPETTYHALLQCTYARLF